MFCVFESSVVVTHSVLFFVHQLCFCCWCFFLFLYVVILIFPLALESSTSPFLTLGACFKLNSACLRKSWGKSGTDAWRMVSLSLARVSAWELCFRLYSSNGTLGPLRWARGWALAWHMPTVRMT